MNGRPQVAPRGRSAGHRLRALVKASSPSAGVSALRLTTPGGGRKEARERHVGPRAFPKGPRLRLPRFGKGLRPLRSAPAGAVATLLGASKERMIIVSSRVNIPLWRGLPRVISPLRGATRSATPPSPRLTLLGSIFLERINALGATLSARWPRRALAPCATGDYPAGILTTRGARGFPLTNPLPLPMLTVGGIGDPSKKRLAVLAEPPVKHSRAGEN